MDARDKKNQKKERHKRKEMYKQNTGHWKIQVRKKPTLWKLDLFPPYTKTTNNYFKKDYEVVFIFHEAQFASYKDEGAVELWSEVLSTRECCVTPLLDRTGPDKPKQRTP